MSDAVGEHGGHARDRSAHPIDRLIRELIQTGRSATAGEIEQILERMATAPFNSQMVDIPFEEQEIAYFGIVLGKKAPSPIYHVVKRVVLDRQWAEGTTLDQYHGDLHRAVRHRSARLGLYHRRSGHIAAVIAPTAAVVGVDRRGPRALPYLLVLYLADRGIIISGYQFSDLAATAIPQEARWLK